jgi:hypothetical protein
MRTLNFELEDSRGLRHLEFNAACMINLGYVGRNEFAVRHHIEELAKEGVPAPATIPLCIPMPLDALSTEAQIDVAGEKTSGEVELAFLIQNERIYVGVGSDHTDREIERTNMALSKQVCPNVIGNRLWDFQELSACWDDLLLQSWVDCEAEGRILYQRAPLKTILPPQRLLDCARSSLKNQSMDGVIVFSGTIGLLKSEFVCGSAFCCELFNPANGRKLSSHYTVRRLSSIFSGCA